MLYQPNERNFFYFVLYSKRRRDMRVVLFRVIVRSKRSIDMCDSIEELCKLHVELTVSERNLFSVAFKNLIGPKRASWRILSSIEQKEEANHDNHKVLMIREYKEQIERELEEVCNRVICIVDTHILPHNQSSEAQCFFFKL
jgi:14-3-3 protein epsilon